MKILMFNTFYHPTQVGGAEKSVQLLAEGLLSFGYEPIVVSTSNRDYIDIVNGVKVYYVNTNNIYWAYNSKEEKSYKKPFWHMIDSYNIFTKHKIENIIKNEKPDVVHTNNLAGFSNIVWKIAKKYDIRLVHTLRDYYQLCPKSTMFKNNESCTTQCKSCKLYSIPKKETSKYVDVVVGISKFILDKHIKYGYFKNAEKKVIFNSVTTPEPYKRIVKNKISFGYVGSLSKSKGIEMLLDTFSKLNIKNIELLVYGKGITKEYENSLKIKYTTPVIIFKGFQKPENIYKNIDILIVPSLWDEPFGRIVPEANSYGIPVLVSNRGGLPELVENGKNGYVFDPDKEENFEKKLDMLLNGKFDKEYILKYIFKFSIKQIIKNYTKVYEY